ncbi:MAG TPA: sigma 54-interacting transcriptional regulator [Polyangia bacterium]|nr:sigma 54-interacting transcriptional regulator [Polyangia bacterium]
MITETTITGDEEEVATGTDGLHLLVMSPDVFASHPLPASGALAIGRSSRAAVHIDDPMASREHAVLRVASQDGAPVLAIEDVGSANGTRVRAGAIRAGQPVPILPGEAVIIGSTVIMVLQNRSAPGPRRLWSHTYFEARVDDECARAAKNKASFALARVRFTGPAHWTKVLPILARELNAPHVFATYGPTDYEILFVDAKEGDVEALIRGVLESCRDGGLTATCGVAWYPKNGRSGDALLATANALLKGRAGQQPAREVAASPEVAAMQRVRDMAARAASSPINVLILGECGVGKDVLAQLVHRLSPRAAKPFVALNCAGLTDSLMDSELFGHERGAFTGAIGAKIGLLESANGGSVFLDEIGDMPLPMQAKLLRVIETREVRPIGALKPHPIDVRFISATNKDLEAAVVKGEFRGDLMYRMNGITLVVPPLRERVDEIPTLLDTFVAAACRDIGRDRPLPVSSEVMDCLRRYHWPGNIRELKNVIERAVALCDGVEIRIEHLPMEKMRLTRELFMTPPEMAMPVARHEPATLSAMPTAEMTKNLPVLTDPTKVAERRRIIDALILHNGNQTRAAMHIGMPRRTFVSKLDYYGIPRPQKMAQAEEGIGMGPTLRSVRANDVPGD